MQLQYSYRKQMGLLVLCIERIDTVSVFRKCVTHYCDVCCFHFHMQCLYILIVVVFIFCVSCSMTLNSVGSQSMASSYDQTDQEHVYNMSHPRRGHFVVINNRFFLQATGKGERTGSDVDAANLFTTFKQLGYEVEIKNNLTRNQMLRLAIDCKSSSLCPFYLFFAKAIVTYRQDIFVFYQYSYKHLIKMFYVCMYAYC